MKRTAILIVLSVVLSAGCGESIEGDPADQGDGNSATTAPPLTTPTSTPSTTTTLRPTTTTTRPSTTTTQVDAGSTLALAGFAGYMGSYSWDGVIVIESDAAGPVVVDAGQIIFRSESGAVIDTDSFYGLILYPGTNYLATTLYEPAAEPVDIEVKYDDADFVDAGRFTVTDLTVDVGRYGDVNMTGEIHSTFAADQDFVTLTFVFFDGDGSPVFADTAFVDLVEAGGTSLFSESVYLDDAAPAWDHVEAYAAP